jgi:hypothetical protein
MRIYLRFVLAIVACATISETASACAQNAQQAYQMCSGIYPCGFPPSGSWAQAVYASCMNNCMQSAMCPNAAQRARDFKKLLGNTPAATKAKSAAERAGDAKTRLSDAPAATNAKPAGQNAASSKTDLLKNSSATASTQKSGSPPKLLEGSSATTLPRAQR